MSAPAEVRLVGLGRRFGPKEVLRDIDLVISPGEAVALTGPNGAGKSTLLRILATLLLPTEGDVLVDGLSVRSDARRVRERVAWVPAMDGGFPSRLTGKENLVVFGALRRLTGAEIARRLDEWRHLDTLRAALETPYFLCSAGMRQSIHIAKGLLTRPGLLLLDEPTRSLDEASAVAIREILRAIEGKTTILFATHSRGELASIATRALSLGGAA